MWVRFERVCLFVCLDVYCGLWVVYVCIYVGDFGGAYDRIDTYVHTYILCLVEKERSTVRKVFTLLEEESQVADSVVHTYRRGGVSEIERSTYVGR